ncbi:hypothetical protein BKA93DRAFT_612426 [Sparassis latifolia]
MWRNSMHHFDLYSSSCCFQVQLGRVVSAVFETVPSVPGGKCEVTGRPQIFPRARCESSTPISEQERVSEVSIIQRRLIHTFKSQTLCPLVFQSIVSSRLSRCNNKCIPEVIADCAMVRDPLCPQSGEVEGNNFVILHALPCSQYMQNNRRQGL